MTDDDRPGTRPQADKSSTPDCPEAMYLHSDRIGLEEQELFHPETFVSHEDLEELGLPEVVKERIKLQRSLLEEKHRMYMFEKNYLQSAAMYCHGNILAGVMTSDVLCVSWDVYMAAGMDEAETPKITCHQHSYHNEGHGTVNLCLRTEMGNDKTCVFAASHEGDANYQCMPAGYRYKPGPPKGPTTPRFSFSDAMMKKSIRQMEKKMKVEASCSITGNQQCSSQLMPDGPF